MKATALESVGGAYRRSTTLAVLITASLGLFVTGPASAQWPQWGGSNRDFVVETSGLADKWPEDGPKELWKKRLGDGYSSIVVDDGVLYTLYRRKNTEAYERIAALDARTGKKVWQHKVPSRPPRDVGEWTFGPNATPLVKGDRLYATTANAVFSCLNKKTGDLLWQHELAMKEDGPLPDEYGYSCSPIAYQNTIIIAADSRQVAELASSSAADSSEPHTLVAFDQETGRVAWSGGDFTMGHSSPVLIEFDGEDQLVYFVKDGLFSLDPHNGRVLWHHPIAANVTNDAIFHPAWNGTNLLFCSSHGTNSGGRAIRLTRHDGQTAPEELWFDRRVFLGYVGSMIGNHIYGSKGPAMIGFKAETGERVWLERGFDGASCLRADDKLIILDMNGQLGLATPSPEGLTIHGKCQILERVSLTPPTLAGTTLYVRDRKHILALDLGEPSNGEGQRSTHGK